MKLTAKTQETFNAFDNRIFDKLQFDKQPLHLNGSYASTFFSLYSGDVDLYQVLGREAWTSLVNTGLLSVIHDVLKAFPNQSGVDEVKVDDTKLSLDQFVKRRFDPDTTQRIKVDFWIVRNGLVEEVTVIYDKYSDATFDIGEFRKDIAKDIRKYRRQNLYKSVKRLRTLLLTYKNRSTSEVDKVLLDPVLGNTYVVLTHLNPLLFKGVSREQRLTALQVLKNTMRKLGLLTPARIKRLDNGTHSDVTKLIQAVTRDLNKLVRQRYHGIETKLAV